MSCMTEIEAVKKFQQLALFAADHAEVVNGKVYIMTQTALVVYGLLN